MDRRGQKHLPIPYDFDYAGFVNAPYAVPYDYLPINKVTDRLYRGICREITLTQYVRDEFFEKENEILDIMDSFKSELPASEFRIARRYLLDFFTIIKNERTFKDQIINKCEKNTLVSN